MTRTTAPSKDDSMSLPLMGLEEDEAPARPAAPAEEEAPSATAEEIAEEVLREQAPSEQDSAEEVDRP